MTTCGTSLRAFALAILGLLAFAPAAPAAFPGDNGKIAFAAFSSGRFGSLEFPNIGTVNPDGSGTTYLTSDGKSYSPAWSPDGHKIAFERLDASPYYFNIYTMNADGSGVTALTSDQLPPPAGPPPPDPHLAWDSDPAWSPDGTRLAFISSRDSACCQVSLDLYTMNADGTGVTRVTNNGFVDDPAWSPLGDEIAFTGTGIRVIKADGTGERFLVSGTSPNWSPDGQRIVYASHSQIHVIDADGTGHVQLTSDAPTSEFDTTPFNQQPAWSPDGTRIVFVHGECGAPPDICNYTLESMSTDGSGRTAVTDPIRFLAPDWQPIPAANQPPDCSGVTASPNSLRRHGFQTVTLAGATDPDGDLVSIEITGVTQDEPVGRRPDARTGTSSDQVELRAQRLARGDGRVYRIAFTASDGTDQCSGVAAVEMRRKKKQPGVDSAPPSYDSFGP